MNSKFCTYDPATKIWSGRKRQQIYNTDANAGYLFLQKLIQTPKNIFQISDDTGVELTCADVYERSLKFANYFTQLNLKQGDVVGLIASNSENLIPIIFGCFVIGVAINPLYIVMGVDEISHMWSKIKPKVIFSDGKVAGIVKAAVDKMELDAKIFTLIDKVEGFQFVDEILEKEFDVNQFEFPDLPNISSTTALISCSSGTSDLPKGICKPHKQIIAQTFPMWDLNICETDLLFNSIPSYWTINMLFTCYGTFYSMPSVITAEYLTPELWMDIIDRHKVNIVFASPRFLSMVIKSDKLRKLESIKYIMVGGTVCTKKLIKDLVAVIPNGKVLNCYGATEADVIAISHRNEESLVLSSGFPFYNVQIKVADEAGAALGPNEFGEIWFKTPAPFSGYFGEANSSWLSIDTDGFIKSGDIGCIDDSGRVFITDRIKHMIKALGALQTTPIEIESIINEIDGVIQSCVVGVFDEEVFYDKIHAFVIKDKARDDLTEEFVVNFVNEKVIEQKKITGGVYFVEKFPMTPSGKVLNRELKKIAIGIRHRG